MLDKLKERLYQWVETKNWKPNVINFVKGYIEDIHPRAITRDSTWGIPVPLPSAEGKVLYVWFDAPIGYISATMEWAENLGKKEKWKDYWFDPGTKLVNFIGKDNIPFHAAIFPAMVMGQDAPYKLVDELPANEFYKLEGRQFSKSDGWYIDLEDFFTRYTADQIRYAIAANAPETSDSEFTWKDFQNKCNTDLLGKYGNLANRVLVFAKNNSIGAVPKAGEMTPVDKQFLAEIHELILQTAEAYENYRLRKASHLLMELAQLGNVYFDSKKPWQDAKIPSSRERMETTIRLCLECLKALSLVSFPIIPETAEKMWAMLGYKDPIAHSSWQKISMDPIPEGQKLSEPKILFARVEDALIAQEIEKLQSLSKKASPKNIDFLPLKELVDIEEVRKLDLRVGVIEHAEEVPKSKKLLKLQVDLGFEKRTIVSGISQFYKPQDLIGQKVIVVANLKPATLMGIESQGMILAGSWDKALEITRVENLPPGSCVS